MVTHEVKVKDGRVYTLRESVSTKDALEYIYLYLRGNDAPLPKIDENCKDIKLLANSAIEATCQNLKDADWLLRHVIIEDDPDSVPLHHTYELINQMRKAIHWGDLIDVVNSFQAEPDPDFPDDESKN